MLRFRYARASLYAAALGELHLCTDVRIRIRVSIVIHLVDTKFEISRNQVGHTMITMVCMCCMYCLASWAVPQYRHNTFWLAVTLHYLTHSLTHNHHTHNLGLIHLPIFASLTMRAPLTLLAFAASVARAQYLTGVGAYLPEAFSGEK